MTTTTHDWTKFTRQIFIKADCPAVFHEWVTASGIASWFIAEAHYTTVDGRIRTDDETIEVGDHYAWKWHQDLNTSGKILEIQENRYLRFTFGDDGQQTDESVIVSVSFTPLDGETRVELCQENMPAGENDKVHWHMGCNMGWSFFLTNLKARMEYGADLREYDAGRAYASRAISL